MLTLIVLFIFVGCMLAAGWNDMTSMTIPNWISLVLVIGYFAVVPFAWQGWSVFGMHILVGVVCFLIAMAMFAFGQLGGGDAKLFAATSIWFLWPDLGTYVVYTALAGGALTLFIIMGRKFFPAKILTTEWLHQLFKNEKKIPYGLALAFGALLVFPSSNFYLHVVENGLF